MAQEMKILQLIHSVYHADDTSQSPNDPGDHNGNEDQHPINTNEGNISIPP